MSIKRVLRHDIHYAPFVKILKSEPHDHEIIEDEIGVIRWRQNDTVRFLFDNKLLDLTNSVMHLYEMGHDKNSEIFRKLYRDLGYSLYGYWEIFYWEANNPIALKYVYGAK